MDHSQAVNMREEKQPMPDEEFIRKTPWDSAVFGLDTYELSCYSRTALMRAAELPGHATIRVDPLESKQLLHEFGYYYCDTLIEPSCRAENFIAHARDGVTVSTTIAPEELLPLCDGAFFHDRFHRDFTVDPRDADRRYRNWLRQLAIDHTVFALLLEQRVAGFFACINNRIVLHALSEPYRGKGLAKYFWSAACAFLYESGHEELHSSVSAANLAVVNLYASLGFRFHSARDIYHRRHEAASGDSVTRLFAGITAMTAHQP